MFGLLSFLKALRHNGTRINALRMGDRWRGMLYDRHWNAIPVDVATLNEADALKRARDMVDELRKQGWRG